MPDRNVFVFVANEEQAAEAVAAGAYKTGGEDEISEISKGRVDVVSTQTNSHFKHMAIVRMSDLSFRTL